MCLVRCHFLKQPQPLTSRVDQWYSFTLYSIPAATQLIQPSVVSLLESRLYKGTLLHQLVGQLRGGVTPDSLLMEDPSSGQLYKAMLDNLKDCYEGTGGREEADE